MRPLQQAIAVYLIPILAINTFYSKLEAKWNTYKHTLSLAQMNHYTWLPIALGSIACTYLEGIVKPIYKHKLKMKLSVKSICATKLAKFFCTHHRHHVSMQLHICMYIHTVDRHYARTYTYRHNYPITYIQYQSQTCNSR